MTVHSVHPNTYECGLADDCPRCTEHAENPIASLDQPNLKRIMALALHPDRFSVALTETDLVAAAKVLTTLERAGALRRTDPLLFDQYMMRVS